MNTSKVLITYYLACTDVGFFVTVCGWKPVLTLHAGLPPSPTILSHLELPKHTCQQSCQCIPQGIDVSLVQLQIVVVFPDLMALIQGFPSHEGFANVCTCYLKHKGLRTFFTCGGTFVCPNLCLK